MTTFNAAVERLLADGLRLDANHHFNHPSVTVDGCQLHWSLVEHVRPADPLCEDGKWIFSFDMGLWPNTVARGNMFAAAIVGRDAAAFASSTETAIVQVTYNEALLTVLVPIADFALLCSEHGVALLSREDILLYTESYGPSNGPPRYASAILFRARERGGWVSNTHGLSFVMDDFGGLIVVAWLMVAILWLSETCSEYTRST